MITWHGFDLTTDGPQAWDLEGAPPTNLTPFGQLQWDYASSWPVADARATPGGSFMTVRCPHRSLSRDLDRQVVMIDIDS